MGGGYANLQESIKKKKGSSMRTKACKHPSGSPGGAAASPAATRPAARGSAGQRYGIGGREAPSVPSMQGLGKTQREIFFLRIQRSFATKETNLGYPRSQTLSEAASSSPAPQP